MMRFNGNEYSCSMELTLDVIGGKWKTIIIWKLGEKRMRFNELKRTMPNITQKMLTQQLRALEEDKLINRILYDQVPPKVEYSLTDDGKSLMPILKELSKWAIDYSSRMNGV